jgi:hypothetical protein
MCDERRKDELGSQTGSYMSNALALVATTALLKYLLENGLVEREITASVGGDAQVSISPPDRLQSGGDDRPRLNLFLFRVEMKGINAASRYAESGAGTPEAPPMLDLYYLLSAYSAQDFQAETLLGVGIDLLHRTPVLPGGVSRQMLAAASHSDGGRLVLPALAALATSGLPERIEFVRICAHEMGGEAMSNLWSSFQSPFRPSATFKVTLSLVSPGASPA